MLFPVATRADDAADIASIEALWESYEATREAGDAEGWLALWDEDGLRTGPSTFGIPLSRLAPRMDLRFRLSPIDEMSVDPEEIVLMGDWAYTRGRFTVFVGRSRTVGAFLSVLRRQEDGSWRIYRDHYNHALVTDVYRTN